MANALHPIAQTAKRAGCLFSTALHGVTEALCFGWQRISHLRRADSVSMRQDMEAGN